jgi:hypothetical protein
MYDFGCGIAQGGSLAENGRRGSPMKRVKKKWSPKTRSMGKEPPESGEGHLRRVRRLCAALPQTEERLSHGEPTFFVGGRVYAMFANNHHADGHVAVWIPVPPGLQATLLKTEPHKFFMPPYVGVRGWVGVELPAIGDEELAAHILEAWRLIAAKKLHGLR